MAAVEEDAVRSIEEAVRFAEQSPDTAPEDWRRYIYAG
jgi:TPP-dependent pyruvate/acetoin dehydrogenase alpha subunit